MKDFDTALSDFMTYITEAKEAERVERFSNLDPTLYSAKAGQKNVKIIVQDHNGTDQSVFCFIRKADGAVLKAAGWKAPAKGARGTIYTDNPKEYGVSTYGANYIR